MASVAKITIDLLPDASALYAGAKLRVTATYTDEAGAKFDSTTVKLNVKRTNPDNSVASTSKFTFGAGPEIVKDAVGVYHYEESPAKPGTITWQWTAAGATEGEALAERVTSILFPTSV